MNLEDFKKGIFQLPHKRFGTLCQIMINKLFSYSSPINNYHDLFDSNFVVVFHFLLILQQI